MHQGQKHTANLLRILCAMGFLLLGFAHQPPAFALSASQLEEMEAFRLPDGSLPVLCLSRSGKNGGPHYPGPKGCEACRLSASVVLPEPVLGAGEALSVPVQGSWLLFLPQVPASGVPPGSSGSRAPLHTS
ncbi:hypothetical protein [Pannonibacter phragmitetus]|uniref:hypothetical protein n=1 Tax=Pannonibacter phragmitetus TaxID=121719 RepID=UPI003D2F44E6